VFINYAKAFDSVTHKRLPLKLEAYGVGKALLQWFHSFLTARRQRVVVNGCCSDWLYVLSGVPLGSILDPLLFILYTNDISSVIQSKIKMFMDNVTLYKTLTSIQDCESLQKDMNSISV